MSPWGLIAYFVKYAAPQLSANLKTEADVLLPYLVLGKLRREQYGWVNPLVRHATRDVVVIDVGAYDGDFVSEVFRVMSHVSDPLEGRQRKREVYVIAVEPNPDAFAALTRRADERGWSESLCAIRAAASDAAHSEAAFVALGPEFGHGQRMGAHLASKQEVKDGSPLLTTVPLTTVDEILRSNRCDVDEQRQVYLLKVDCEGHDGKVLHGAAELLKARRVKYLLFEQMTGYDADRLEETLSWLWELGYGCFLVLDRFLVSPSVPKCSRGGCSHQC
eukprot:TRINITY_DN28903_c0_g1_i4.p1 TRINITY_DN28903_c0_g1~~TRINITY_DN28903_c0_g1_i4.p1  ORF type:complete len:276 (+),score=42.85 TRINITY_DN28903_c0_g1_i4:137-964(+)